MEEKFTGPQQTIANCERRPPPGAQQASLNMKSLQILCMTAVFDAGGCGGVAADGGRAVPNEHFMRRASVTALLAAMLLASGCNGSNGDNGSGSVAGNTARPAVATAVEQALQNDTPVAQQIVAADNAFGLALFDALNQGAPSNVAISPTSIALTLQMLYNGAEGSTQQGMSQALQLQGLGPLAVDQDNAALQAALIDPDPEVQLTTANSLWMQLSRNPVLPSFVSTNETYYAAEIGDLSGAPDDVNAWVASATNGLITQVLPPENYNDVLAVLANAIYFKGEWKTPFNPNETAAAPFTLTDGSQVSCQMMKQTAIFPYLAGADFQAVELPYGQTGRLSMLIILPAPGVDLGSFVASMTNEELSTWLAEFEPGQVSVGLPRFSTTYASSLVQGLTSLGMGTAFSPAAADFAGLASAPGVYISDVEQKAVVQVDESGTVAAATTTVTIIDTMRPPITMNRPFFYAIVDGKTGALLFIGTLVDPSQSSG
jgi:serine protease inhibitor